MRYRWLSRWLERPRARFELAVLVGVLSLPAIGMGMVADDYDIAAAVADDAFGAYRFSAMDADARARQHAEGFRTGERPWWASAHERHAFLRPLASLSHAIDFRLWPGAAWLMHVENALLYADIVLLVWALYGGLGLSPGARGLASLCYAFNGNHAMTVGWISGRNTLLSVAFGLLAILLHVRAFPARGPSPRRRGAARWGSVACLVAALLSSEGGVAALAFIGAHALLLQQGELRHRARALAPHLVVLVAWLGVYFTAGFGVSGSGFYRSPAHDPAGVLGNLAAALPIYLGSQLTVAYASLSGIRPGALLPWALVSLGLVALTAYLMAPVLWRSRQARMFALGSTLSVVPLATTLPQDRLVFFVGLGTCGLLGMFLDCTLGDPVRSQAYPDAHPHPPSRTAQRVFARVLITLRGAVLPLLFVPVLFSSMNQFLGGGAVALDGALPKRAEAHVVLLNGPSHLPVHFVRNMRARSGRAPMPTVDMLYAGGGDAVLTRTGEHTLNLEVARGYFATSIESTVRDIASDPFRPGQVVEHPRMRVTIEQVNADGAPTRVRFELRPPHGGERLFYAWSGRAPEPLTLPPVGEQFDLRGAGPI